MNFTTYTVKLIPLSKELEGRVFLFKKMKAAISFYEFAKKENGVLYRDRCKSDIKRIELLIDDGTEGGTIFFHTFVEEPNKNQ